MNSLILTDSEYAPYYTTYISNLGTSDLFELLDTSLNEALDLLKTISEEKQHYRYAKNKWTIKELIQHIIDTERILSYRALRFSRNDATDLPGFDENWYVAHSNANNRVFDDLLQELLCTRKSTISFFKSLTTEQFLRTGSANNNDFTVRALAFIIVGHLKHHITIIKERYL